MIFANSALLLKKQGIPFSITLQNSNYQILLGVTCKIPITDKVSSLTFLNTYLNIV